VGFGCFLAGFARRSLAAGKPQAWRKRKLAFAKSMAGESGADEKSNTPLRSVFEKGASLLE